MISIVYIIYKNNDSPTVTENNTAQCTCIKYIIVNSLEPTQPLTHMPTIITIRVIGSGI